MTDTTQYPSIHQILGYAETGTEIYKWSKQNVALLAAEIHALIAERDALKAQQPKVPERKLREYTSVASGARYRVDNGVIEFWDGHNSLWREPHAVNVLDVVPLSELVESPYEPVETVEEVLRAYSSDIIDAWHKGGYSEPCVKAYVTRLRAAATAEHGGAE